MYGVSSLFWLFILSKLPLSLAYPLVSMGYVLVVFFSWLLLREQVGIGRMVGVAVICCGVALLALSAPASDLEHGAAAPAGPASEKVEAVAGE
jgi:drug/metabolite transporter (DMT)-like permease